MVRDMTKGSPWRHIIVLALPLLLGNIFQASYNLVDTIIVGRFVKVEALAGVGAASPVFNLITALLTGLSVGASILISQLFGGGRRQELPAAVSTTLWMSLGLSLVLTVVGQLVAKPLLVLLQTPAEDFPYAILYLRTVFCGLVCNVFYNLLTGMLRGLGNTVVPLLILIFSCCANAGMDVIFVCLLGMGVAGTGIATIIAEGMSALLTWIYIKKAVPYLHTDKQQRFNRDMFMTVLRFGFPMGLQQASISFGHVLMQGIVNSFDTALIAGYTASSKVDMFAVMPIISLGSALSAFSAQNTGAKLYDRVRLGCRTGCVLTFIICIPLTFLVTPLRFFWTGLFVSGSQPADLANAMVAAGAGMLAVTPLFYWLLGLIHALTNTMAGAGDTVFAMVAMISMMLLRVLFAWILIHAFHMGETGIWWAFVLSWAVTFILAFIHYRRGRWMKIKTAS